MMSEPQPQVWLAEDGILRIRYPANSQLTLACVEQVHRQHLELTTLPLPLLVYAESVASAEYEAQQFASREEVATLVTAMAIIVKSAFTRALAELFMRFHRPPYPTRVFSDEQPALTWLQQFLTAKDGTPGPDNSSA